MFSLCLNPLKNETTTKKTHETGKQDTQKAQQEKHAHNGHKKTAAYILIRAAAFISLP